MKILQIINSFEGGGAEKLTLDLHESYLNQGIDSYAVSLEASNGKLPYTYTLGLKSCYQLLVVWKLFLFLSQPQWRNLDIIHVHLFPSQLLVPLICRILGIKAVLITTEHNTINRRIGTIFGKLVDVLFYQCYQKIICNSYGTWKMMLNWQPKLSERMSVVYNGINTNNYKNNFLIERTQKSTVIISVGRLAVQKNYGLAIKAMTKIVDRDFEYWIVGAGVLERELRDLVTSLNLDRQIKFLGFRDDIPQLLAQADIFLQTSLWEGFGLAVVEAMAAGLPVVVSDVPGVREVVGNNSECGFLIDPTSQSEIAEKLIRLIDDLTLQEMMGNHAQIRASDFDLDRTIQEHLTLYHSVCKNNSSYQLNELPQLSVSIDSQLPTNLL